MKEIAAKEIAAAVDWGTPPAGLDAIAAELAAMRAAAGKPSFAAIGRAVGALRAARGAPASEQRIARSTLYDCFRSGRRRVDYEAVLDIASALGLPASSRPAWAERVTAAQAHADGAAVAIVHERVPAPVPYFSGSGALISEITTSLSEPVGRVWIAGMPGSGKSQLAFMVAQQLRERGTPSLFLDLRGYHAQSPPVDPLAARRALLRSLGQAEAGDDAHPADLAGAAQASGTVLILDDAVDSAHVAAVVGERPECQVLVTSRKAAAPPDWRTITPRPMAPADVGELLGHFAPDPDLAAGADLAELDAAAIERLTALADGLPLALSLVAARLRTHPHWSLAEQADYLHQRLHSAHLDAELTVSLRLSYDVLTPPAAALLRLFADLPVAELDPAVAAIVTGTSQSDARRHLGELVAGGLAVARADDRVALHSVVRSFARAEALEQDPPTVREAAFVRLTTHVAEQVWRAYRELARSMDDRPRPTRFAYPAQTWDPAGATAWLHANLADILALAHAAPGRGVPELQWRISEGMSLWMSIAGHIEQALLLHEAAAATAAQHGDHNALAMASLDAGQLLVQLDQPDLALAHFQRATRLVHDSRALADPGLRGLLLNMSGLVELRYGRLRQAQAALEEAAAVHTELGEDARLMSALVNLGLALQYRGEEDHEARVWERGLDLARAKDHSMFIANFLVNRSRMHARSGDARQGLTDALEAVAAACSIGFAYLEATGLGSAAEAHRLLGQLDEAGAAASRALEIARDLGATLAIAELLVVAADLAATAGEGDLARRRLAEAEALLPPGRDPMLRGHIWHRRGNLAPSPAERANWWRQAREAFGESDCREARQVRAGLAALTAASLEES